ncbi:MAG: hypothetical protein [Caudoviricetes sp.]|nr:MAG: hypothetical protein [Caudoviricetes sp.]
MKIEIPAGVSLYKAIEIAKDKAHENRWGEVGLDFNGINLVVHKDSLDLDISTIYQLECRLRQK